MNKHKQIDYNLYIFRDSKLRSWARAWIYVTLHDKLIYQLTEPISAMWDILDSFRKTMEEL